LEGASFFVEDGLGGLGRFELGIVLIEVVMIRAEKFYEELGRSIRTRRKVLKMTQAELGDRLGLSRTSVTHIECGRQRLFIDQFCRLAQVPNCQRDDLLTSAMAQGSEQKPATRDLASMPAIARFVQKTS
jgi:DNA-binding XRE family transcriptional regulator